MAMMGAQMMHTVLDELAAGRAQATPQSNIGVTYAKKVDKADQPIDWNQPAAAILHQVRGLSPMPGAVTKINGELIKLYDAALEKGDAAQKAGIALDENLLINAGDGQALRLLNLQRAGKARQPASQFLQGFSVAKGSIVESL
jgi:methionyl-tRNA formyltransferase